MPRQKHSYAWTDLTPTERARALAAILAQQGAMMAREAHRNYAGSGSPEDFIMDLIAKILDSPPDVPVEHGAPADRWVNTVIRNKRRDAYRAENRHRRILRQAHGEPGHWLSEHPGESPERIVMRRMEHADVLRRIGRLPGHLRDVALLRYDGYSYAEIGDVLGISDVTARQRAASIRADKIRRLLD
jgi:RNA polymerase sigma factor (sigma-70 family)